MGIECFGRNIVWKQIRQWQEKMIKNIFDKENDDLLKIREEVSKFLVKKGVKIREYMHKESKAS